MRIFFDCDGVLSDFESNAVRVHNELWPDRALPLDYKPTNWDWDLDKKDWNKLWRAIDEIPDFWLREAPLEENVSALRTWLKEAQHQIYYVTARRDTCGTTAYQQTAQWLMRYGLYPSFVRLIVVKHPSEKKQVVHDLQIDFSIDDKPSTVVDLNMLPWHHSYLLDQPWNRESSQTRVSSLQEFLDIVDAADRSGDV